MTPGDLITAYKYLQGNNIIERKELFILSEMTELKATA